MHSGLELGSLARMMRTTALAGELLFQRFEPGNEHAFADLRGHRLFAARSQPIPSMASMSPRVDTNRANASPIAATASPRSVLPRKCAPVV